MIEAGGKRYVWGIPLAFPVTDDEARALSRGGAAAIRTEEGEMVAIVEDLEVFELDKARYVQKVYGTERFDHPGGRMVESDPRSKLLGGRLSRAAAAAPSRVRRVHALAAPDARADPRPQVGARAGLPDAQPAAPRPRVRARGRAPSG